MFDNYAQSLRDTLKKIDSNEWDAAIRLIKATYEADNQILTCGNGGSASTASHYITDWNKMTQHFNGKGIRGICLADNLGIITAYANDYSYNDIFSEQVKIYGKKSDLLIAVSGSGNSKNIIKAIDEANELGLITLAVTGYSGGVAAKRAKYKVHVPVNDMQISEDLHLVFGHMVMKEICI